MSFATPAQAAAPEFPTSTTTRSIAENTPADTDVGDVIPEATDADNDDLTYSMEGTDAASFNFNATTRQITTKSSVDYDYETQPTWSVTVKADDGNGGTDIIAVTINLTNLPAVSIAPRQKRVLLSDGRVSFEFTSDVRPTGDLSVALVAVQDQPWIEVARLSLGYGEFLEGGWITSRYDFKPDAPAQGGNFTVTLQPGAGYELGTKTATVEIVAADPLITVSAAQASYSSAESAGTQTVTLRAQTIAGAPRPLVADIALEFTWTATADTATGGGTDFRDASGTVSFLGTDFTEQGGRWVASREVQVALVDDSASEPDERFHVTLARHSSLHRLVKFANADADGTLCENNAPGVNCGATITITDNDGGNDPPAFDADSDTRSLVENSVADTDVGDPVTATDGDDDTLTYSLEGAHAGSFTIDASSGQIKTKNGVDYDYETQPTWSVTVKADDGNGGTDIIAVTINLTNLPAVSIAPLQERVLLSDGRVSFEFTSDVRPTGDLSVALVAVQDQPWIEVARLSLGYGEFLEGGWITSRYDFKPDAPVQGGNFTVTLQPGAGYELGTKTATVEVVAADPLITVSAAQASYSSAESAGTQTVTLRAQTIAGAPRPLVADIALEFTWTATADTATGGGTDFRDAGGRVTFIRADFTEKGGRWVASREVQVALVDDSASEPDERFHVTLARHSTLHRLVKLANADADGTLCENNAPGVNCGATITIRDDEPPTVGFVGATTVSEGEGTYTARVALNHAGTETFTVDYRSRDASATAGQDYTAVSGTLTFAPGESEKTFAVPILNDTLIERERFELVLSGVDTSKAVLDPDTSSIAVDIEDDGDTALVRWRESTLDIMEGETGRQLIAETVGQGFLFPLAINLAVSDPDGAIHPDTTALARDLVLDPEARSAARDIRTLDDTVKQGHRTVTVTITGSDHSGVVPDPARATVTIRVLDDESLPSAPRSLSGTGDEGTVTLEWEASDDRGTPIDRYESRYRVADGSWPASWTPAPDGADARSVRITGLDPTGRYEFEVRAVNRNGEGPVAGVVAGASVSYGTLTAAFEEYPDPLVHFGEAFRVTLKLSQLVGGERPEMIGRGVRVSGGTARHVEPHFLRPQHVHLEVTPSGTGDVEVVLEPLPCEVAGAICTSGGNGLAGRQTLSVRGVGSAPGRPANVQELRTDDGYVVLFWDLNDDATAYTLRWRPRGGEWREESGRPPGPNVQIHRFGATRLAPAELPAEAFGPLERGRSYDVELRWENPRGSGSWLDVSDAVRNLTPPRPQSLTLHKLGPTAVALSWQNPPSSATVDKHQFRLGRHPTSVDSVLGGIGPQNPANRVFKDDGWMDFPADAAGPLGHVLRGEVGGQRLIHVWELKAQVRSVTAEGEVSQASNVAFMPDTAPTMVRVGVVSDPGSDDVYESGETIAVELELDEPVRVRGSPLLNLQIHGHMREARYAGLSHPFREAEVGWGANEGTILRFEYDLVSADGQVGADDILIDNQVTLNGATVTDATRVGNGLPAVLSWASAGVTPMRTPRKVTLPELSVADTAATEGPDAHMSFTVTLSAASLSSVTVDYATADGSATAGSDYTAASGTLSFAAGQTSKTVTVGVLQDNDAEPDETLTLRLSKAVGANLVQTEATGTIVDGEPLDDPMLSISDARAKEGEDTTMSFTVTLHPASGNRVSVGYLTYGGTATEGAGMDYTGVAGDLYFAPGETSKTITVTIFDDGHDDNGEYFHILLYGAEGGAGIDDEEGTGTILNTDPMPQAWLARFGRAASDHAIQAIERRWQSAQGQQGRQPESHLTIGGRRLDNLLQPWLPAARPAAESSARASQFDAGSLLRTDLLFTDERERLDQLRAQAAQWRRKTATSGQMPGGNGRSGGSANGSAGGGGRDAGVHAGSGGMSTVSSGMATSGMGASGMGASGSLREVAGSCQPARSRKIPSSCAKSQDLLQRGYANHGAMGRDPASAGESLFSELLLSGLRNAGGAPAPKLRDLAMGSSFFYSRPADPENSDPGWLGQWAAWGETAATRFSGVDGKLSLDGEVTTATMGMDSRRGRWLAGVSLSLSEGAGVYRHPSAAGGLVSSTLTSINPYAHYTVNDRTSVWAVLGYGAGNLTLTPESGAGRRGLQAPCTGSACVAPGIPARAIGSGSGAGPLLETDLATAMAAIGGRSLLHLQSSRLGSFQLALVSDARVTGAASRAIEGLVGVRGDTSRVRLLLEGAGAMPLGRFGTLSPSLEAGLRHDGGDAETGAGFELGGGLGYAVGQLQVQLNGRTLLAHEDAGYEEWGVSGSIQYQSGGGNGQGLLLRLGSAWGADQSGVQSMWSREESARGLARGGPMSQGQRYQAEFGYGIKAPYRERLWYPYLNVESSGANDQALRFGLKLTSGANLEAGLELGRRLGQPGEKPANAIMLQGTLRW